MLGRVMIFQVLLGFSLKTRKRYQAKIRTASSGCRRRRESVMRIMQPWGKRRTRLEFDNLWDFWRHTPQTTTGVRMSFAKFGM